MNFPKKYKKMKSSIVAIASNISTQPDFPDIIGTGFIAHSEGVIITNNHVIEAINKLPRKKDSNWGAMVIYFQNDPNKGMFSKYLEIEGVSSLSPDPNRKGVHYDDGIPDVGVIFVKAKGLPTIELEDKFNLQEGDDVFISGFPMGTRTLRAPGWIHQINPTLQRGIVSSLQPFPCKYPHGFTLEIVAQGGSSGSPIFNSKTGKVAGLLYGGMPEIGALKDGQLYKQSTSITLAIPAYIVKSILDKAMSSAIDKKTGEAFIRDTSKYKTIKEMLDEEPVTEMKPKERYADMLPINNDEIEYPSK